MRNNVIAYKVLRYIDGTYSSAVQTGKSSIDYPENTLIKAAKDKGKGIFIFSGLEEAIRFTGREVGFATPKLYIWRVSAHNVKDFFIDEYLHRIDNTTFPKGTLFCSSLRLTRLIFTVEIDMIGKRIYKLV